MPGLRLLRRGPIAAALAAAAAFAALAAAGPAAAAPDCTRYASPAGNDAAAGTAEAPFRSAQKLADSLAGGGTGCFLAGTYSGNVIFRSGGSAATPLTLTTAPGHARATLHAIVQIDDSANHVTLENLRLDGTNPPTANGTQVMIFGDHATLRGNEIFNGGQRICVSTGDANGRYGVAWHPVVDGNRIHDCGNRAGDAAYQSYPAGHALYLQADRHARIVNNTIYDLNFGGKLGGRGIQLWPDSQHAVIEHNVVDNANQWSIIISGGNYPTGTTQGTKVRNNVFSNPVEHNVTSAWWGVAPTPGNEVTGNCVSGAPGGNFAFQSWLGQHAYLERDNVSADPQFVDRAGKDFRLRAGSPCAGKGPQDAGAAPPAASGSGSAAPAAGASSPPSSASTAAPSGREAKERVRRSARVLLRFRGVLRGRIVGTRAARSMQAAGSGQRSQARTLTIYRKRGGAWRVFARVRSDRAGRFVVRKRPWSRASRLQFRAVVQVAPGLRVSSRVITLRKSSRGPSAFRAAR
jgi:Right handed beta helix region